MRKMGEINKWPQGMVEHTVYPEVKNKAFHLPCEIKKMARQKLPLPPRYIMVVPEVNGTTP